VAILSSFLTLLALVGAFPAFGSQSAQEASTESTPSAETAENRTPKEVLEEGNRLFRLGRLEEALAVYRAGWDPKHPHAVLAYNLGTAAHHLGRLPEAVLWYRRAAAVSEGDLWLTENLERARESLAAPRPGPPGLLARLVGHTAGLWILAAVAGWIGLLLQMTGLAHPEGASRWRPADGLVVITLVLAAAALVIPRLAPEPAVVLEACGDGALPAGAEVWGRDKGNGVFEVRAPEGPIPCEEGRAEPIAGPRSPRPTSPPESGAETSPDMR